MKTGKYMSVLIAGAMLAASGQAQQSYWVVPSGDFSTAANWSPVAVPTAADSLTFNNSGVGVPNNQTINMDVSATVKRVYADWDAQNYLNTISGPGTLTVGGGYAWIDGIANRAGGDGSYLALAGNVVINNPSGPTDVRNQNSGGNITEFTPSSTLTLQSTLVTLDFASGSAIRFNGSIGW